MINLLKQLFTRKPKVVIPARLCQCGNKITNLSLDECLPCINKAIHEINLQTLQETYQGIAEGLSSIRQRRD